ncbi:hypothetical protein [Parahaliea mediterranea]|uniref:Uncharacterized protein n=1 Tax=Parahaliea mediterranea TaxID=651086 RepID=A0A939IL19_9GAMM|nr:hypothetical protein [Parahaliea mediterranea]MBN7797926.1 hypothetical protein [Parahaliea mediterranea]
MKQHRRLIRGITAFVTTAYILIVSGIAGGGHSGSPGFISDIARALPTGSGSIEYAIYVAVLPAVVLWVVVLRVTRLSQEEKDIEDFKRRYERDDRNTGP